MIRRSLSFLAVVFVAGAISGQTPVPKPDMPVTPRTFAWSFSNEGGYLGIQTAEVTRENFAKLGLREVRGVVVEKVLENSPAAAAGLQKGDVIVRFDGDEVSSVRKLTRLISEVDPDHQAKLTVVRGSVEREITVTLGKHPGPKFEAGSFDFNFPRMGRQDLPNFGNWPPIDIPRVWTPGEGSITFSTNARQIGASVTPLTKQLAEHFRVDGGMLVSEVRENSPASKAGLKAGDIIVEADGKAVKSQLDLMKAINDKKQGDVQLTIVRNGSRQAVTVSPEVSKDSFLFQKDDENR